eukprot:CAMPEP_0173450824 /NCGR_PEP_ID=MMETSP1357-20121228/45523_1 /TAXON_ID=77926 /ORGANISM="Hemiselmis rufescens, Strain PCC563" /LENGTH=38 /DNA_ID= /DNA_START= /DNA_END= /DNA_ORIENTATION=
MAMTKASPVKKLEGGDWHEALFAHLPFDPRGGEVSSSG